MDITGRGCSNYQYWWTIRCKYGQHWPTHPHPFKLPENEHVCFEGANTTSTTKYSETTTYNVGFSPEILLYHTLYSDWYQKADLHEPRQIRESKSPLWINAMNRDQRPKWPGKMNEWLQSPPFSAPKEHSVSEWVSDWPFGPKVLGIWSRLRDIITTLDSSISFQTKACFRLQRVWTSGKTDGWFIIFWEKLD